MSQLDKIRLTFELEVDIDPNGVIDLNGAGRALSKGTFALAQLVFPDNRNAQFDWGVGQLALERFANDNVLEQPCTLSGLIFARDRSDEQLTFDFGTSVEQMRTKAEIIADIGRCLTER